MKSEYVDPKKIDTVLSLMMSENALAVRVSMYTGLRIGDVLALKRADVARQFVVREQKTAKKRRVYLNEELLEALLLNAGRVYCFEHRSDWTRHRTRQAVYNDIKRVTDICKRLVGRRNVTPHSARKVYAVTKYRKYGDIRKVQALLNHERESVTMIYALADIL